MDITAETTVGAIATEHPLATRVFSRHDLDYCCGGGRPLAEACKARGVEVDPVLDELRKEIAAAPAPEVRWDQESLPSLIDHIVRNYHYPLREELPRIETMAHKVHSVHGEKDPERFQAIVATVIALKGDIDQHMMKEERILFPMIASGQGGMAGGPISVMEMEHEAVGVMLRRLRKLTDDYRVPEGACNTWRALWVGLSELERSLHDHIHLENNILHKRALES